MPTALKLKLISTHLINTQNTLLKSHLTIDDTPRTKFSPGSTNKPRFQHDEQAIAWTFHHTRTSNHPLQWTIRITKRSMIPNYSFLPQFHNNDKSLNHRSTHQNSIPTPANPNYTDHHQKPWFRNCYATIRPGNPTTLTKAPKTAYAPTEFDFPEP